MSIVIDFFIIIIVLVCIIAGYKRGLVNLIINLSAFIIALIIAIILYRPITNFIINNTEIKDNISNCIYEKIKDEDIEKTDNQIIQLANKYILNDTKEKTAEIISENIAETIIEVLTFVVLITFIRISLIIINRVFSIITEIPIIKQFNKLGGVVYGALVGIFIIYLILAIMFFVIFVNNNGTIAQAINTSTISKILYNNNILLNIIF